MDFQCRITFTFTHYLFKHYLHFTTARKNYAPLEIYLVENSCVLVFRSHGATLSVQYFNAKTEINLFRKSFYSVSGLIPLLRNFSVRSSANARKIHRRK